jgi:hypothetical protein
MQIFGAGSVRQTASKQSIKSNDGDCSSEIAHEGKFVAPPSHAEQALRLLRTLRLLDRVWNYQGLFQLYWGPRAAIAAA